VASAKQNQTIQLQQEALACLLIETKTLRSQLAAECVKLAKLKSELAARQGLAARPWWRRWMGLKHA